MKTVPVLALHPALPEEYRRNVEALGKALRDPVAMEEAVPRLRALIDHIIITPTARLRGVDLMVVRKIDEAMRLAHTG